MLKPPAVVSVSDITFAAAGQTLIDAVSLSFQPVGTSVVMGPNGAGKSLLLRLISGLIEPDSGKVEIGTGPGRNGSHATLMAQRPVLLRRTVAANLEFALDVRGVPGGERRSRIDELLAMVGLQGLHNRPARKLSGGEQQRLSLARALAMNPDVLLLDEPTANLDPTATAQIEKIVKRTSEAGVKIIFVTHSRDQARRLADEIVFMHRGRVIEQSAVDPFFHEPSTKEASDFLAGTLLV